MRTHSWSPPRFFAALALAAVSLALVIGGRARAQGPRLESLHFEEFGIALGVAVEGSRAYISVEPRPGAPHEVRVYDIADPSRPRLLGTHRIQSAAGIFVENGVAYLARGLMEADAGWLTIIDFTNPSQPRQLGEVALPHGCIGVAMRADFAYVGCYGAGLFVVDVGDPRAPRVARRLEFPHPPNPNGLARLVCTARRNDPRAQEFPCVMGRIWWLHVDGPTLYVANENAGMVTLDVSNPGHPRELSTLMWGVDGEVMPEYGNNDTSVDGDIAYVTLDSGGVASVDISNLRDPLELDRYGPWDGVRWGDAAGHTTQISARDGWLFTAAGEAGVMVLDARDPRNLRLAHQARLRERVGSAWGLALSGDLVLATYTRIDPGAATPDARGRTTPAWRRRGGWEIFRFVGPVGNAVPR